MGLVFASAEGCGQKPHGTPQEDAEVLFCQGDEECPVGMLCIGNVCQLPVDAGIDASEGLQPNISTPPCR
jgi:hypothetical protein